MGKIRIVMRKRVEEQEPLLETIQIHADDTNDTPDDFRRRFPVGIWLDFLATTEIAYQADSSLHHEGDGEDGKHHGSVQ